MPYKQTIPKAKEQKMNKVNAYGEKILAQGQADDLISDSGTRRVWRSRIDNKLSEEKFIKGRWEMVD